MTPRPTRRQLLRSGAALAGGAAAGILPEPFLRALAAPAPGCASLADIEHVVIFIQENRSFDHYFGRYPGVAGFDDRTYGEAIFRQANPGQTPNPVVPFHINTTDSGTTGECIHDIGHQWVEQHHCWDQGRLDGFVKTHVAAEGPVAGPLTMGYYDNRDLPLYWALADNFTICDRFFTSTISGTVANRVYGLTGMIDPDGKFGGPVVNTPEAGNQADYRFLVNSLSWRTYPEVLEDAGVSWKFYNPDPPDVAVQILNDNYLLFFKQYYANPSLAQKAFASQDYPVDFIADCQNGTLPAVSWLLTPFVETEHPPTPLTWGEFAVGQALSALMSNPALWAKTVFLLTWDDNGGFFDHVIPPFPPAGTPGEYLTATPPVGGDGGVKGPIGLGFRVPMIVVSPFSRNPVARSDPSWRPMVCSDTLDHTSVLRFLASWLTAKGHSASSVALPYDTAWRRATVGDLTTAFNFASPREDRPSLPFPTATDFAAVLTLEECALAANTELPDPQPDAYPIPTSAALPTQLGRGVRPVRPSGLCAVSAAVPTRAPGSLPATNASPRGGLVAALFFFALAWLLRRRGVREKGQLR